MTQLLVLPSMLARCCALFSPVLIKVSERFIVSGHKRRAVPTEQMYPAPRLMLCKASDWKDIVFLTQLPSQPFVCVEQCAESVISGLPCSKSSLMVPRKTVSRKFSFPITRRFLRPKDIQGAPELDVNAICTPMVRGDTAPRSPKTEK